MGLIVRSPPLALTSSTLSFIRSTSSRSTSSRSTSSAAAGCPSNLELQADQEAEPEVHQHWGCPVTGQSPSCERNTYCMCRDCESCDSRTSHRPNRLAGSFAHLALPCHSGHRM